jgi:hypothetical protein
MMDRAGSIKSLVLRTIVMSEVVPRREPVPCRTEGPAESEPRALCRHT